MAGLRVDSESTVDSWSPAILGGVSWYESRIDRAIREAQERGDFDNLPGTGKPLPDRGELHDEDWWLKQLIERENLTGLAPTSLRLRKEVEELDEHVGTL